MKWISMARPRQFDEADVQTALSDVFWKHGYEGASYSDIMKATGLNKGSLYSSFGDKRALYQHAISAYKRDYLEPLLTTLRDEEISPRDRIKTFMDRIVQRAQTPEGRRGCFLCNAAVDQSPFDSEVESQVTSALSSLRKALKSCVNDTAAEDKFDLIWSAYFGGNVMVKAGFSKAVMRSQRAQVLSLFD